MIAAVRTADAHAQTAITHALTPRTSPPPYLWTRVEIHWSTVIGIALLAAVYLWGIGPLRRRNGWAERAPRGQAAPDRLIVRGRSAGGFTTLAALTFRPGLFKAGASYYGVADLECLARDTHRKPLQLERSGLPPYRVRGHV